MTAYGIVSKGNGEAFLTREKHTSLTSGGGQAGQGYPCVLAERGEAMTDKEKSLLIELLEEWMYEKEDADRTLSILGLIDEIKETMSEV